MVKSEMEKTIPKESTKNKLVNVGQLGCAQRKPITSKQAVVSSTKG
ncbi:hypothetical protein [Desemzia sp. FAM 23989]